MTAPPSSEDLVRALRERVLSPLVWAREALQDGDLFLVGEGLDAVETELARLVEGLEQGAWHAA